MAIDDSSVTRVEKIGWCAWANSSECMRQYHDHEWGFPVTDDRHLFEKLCLEAFQCGLSWSTILARRERFRDVFSQFDIEMLVSYDESDVERLMNDETIIRHRGKIRAVLTNAHSCRRLIEEKGSLAAHLWSFAPSDPDRLIDEPSPPATSPESIRLARDLKSRGWAFVGPTTMYALMQSMGMVNDHDRSCAVRTEVVTARALSVFP